MRVFVYLKRLFYGVAAMLLLAVTLGPWGLYWLGLNGVNGRPTLPATQATQSEMTEVWLKAKGKGQIEVAPLSPHGYIYSLYKRQFTNPGAHLAWRVAANHLLANKKYKGNSWWHFSGAALTIWVTRNWSTGQIASRVVEIEKSNNG
jgi:hypothetical protein